MIAYFPVSVLIVLVVSFELLCLELNTMLHYNSNLAVVTSIDSEGL